VSTDRVETDILKALDFIDDELWCAQKAAEMALTRLELKAAGAGHRTAIRLTVGGIADPLNDPRIPALVVSIGQYRRTHTITIFGIDPDWRLAISTGPRADKVWPGPSTLPRSRRLGCIGALSLLHAGG